ncbi:T9SS type A sorting domain-containing protein [candidate division WOR-3 bacterium]|nr:T9SS type A sorting domain-containing protein [candidate division WOR-3 bacterium]
MSYKGIFATLFLFFSLTTLLHGDEEKIVFAVKTDEDNSVIYTINPNGTGLQELFSWTGELVDSMGRIHGLRISPGGEYIAFASNHDRWYSPFEWNVFHIASDGSWWDMDTPDAAAGWYNPPGGRGIVHGYITGFGSPGTHAWVTIEGYPNLITTNTSGYYEVSNVPEGSRFITAFSFDYGWYGYTSVNVIADMSVEAPTFGTTEDNWARISADAPAWSSDANYIYWQALDESVLKTPRGGDSWTEIFEGPPTYTDRSTIDISPVNGKIVYTWSVWDPHSGGVYTANPDGSDTTKIFDDEWAYASSVYYPRWSPDGERIAYVSFQDDNNAAVVIDKNGAFETYFYYSGYYLHIGGWSPNNKWLAVVIEPMESKTDSAYICLVKPDYLDSSVCILGLENIEIGIDWGILNPPGVEEETDDRYQMSDIRLQVYPNPFIKETIIQYTISNQSEDVTLKIFDVAGRIVEKITVDEHTGNRTLCWRPDLPTGIYFIHLVCKEINKTLKVIKLQ